MSFKRSICSRIVKHILIPFLIVILSGILLFHSLMISSIIIRPFIVVYYGVFISSVLTIYFWICDNA